MAFITNDNERKSLLITTAIFVVMLLVIFLYKFQVVETTSNMLMGGEMAIRFGNSEVGNGPLVPADLPAPSKTKPQPEQAEATEKKIVTQNVKESVIVKSSEVKTKTDNNHNTTKKSTQTTTTPVNKVHNSTNDLLNTFSNSKGTSTTSGGTGGTSGQQGRLDGDPYSISRFGGSGSGNGVGNGAGWGLNGRTLVSHTVQKPDCTNESGTVVVEITVNKSGSVSNAKLNLSGTTNTAKCLVDAAISTAKTFKWRADNNAPDRQIGFVVINFKVG
ncbi:MAG TPA: hypothetical protein VLY87_07665 [Flavobacterium sp.]|nr:hypothetical protein [Flavobacterium sp.]